MRISVLGATEARLGDAVVDLRTTKQRAMLAALALHHGDAVSPDRLVDLVWGDAPPVAVSATMHSYVARLRRDLEPDRAPRAPSRRVLTVPGGYLLTVDPADLDSSAFEAATTTVHAELRDATALDRDTAAQLDRRLVAALATWRGTPFLELGDHGDVAAERARLEQLRLVALEDRAVLGLVQGHHARVAAELEALTRTHPLRERLWGLLATALARDGRQVEALDALRTVRQVLDDELGLEPGPALRALQTAILRQDKELLGGARVNLSPVSGPVAGWAPDLSPDSVGRARRRRTVAPGWPFVGRERERAALIGLLAATRQGTPSVAVVTGESGIGVSRLCAELTDAAFHAGVRVLTAACRTTEGAPPLRPWSEVLAQLGRDLPVTDETGGNRFEAWDRVVQTVVAAADEHPTVLVLEDLHGADVSTLRVLRLLVEATLDTPLLLVVTWRAWPVPRGPLAEVAEVLARRHALRIELAGLDGADTALLAHAITGRPLDREQVGTLRDRTDGHPFFIVELCRLSGVGDPLQALLVDPDPPASVRDVVERRMAELSLTTQQTLRAAAVAGRTFDLASLAAGTDRDPDELLDSLDEAVGTGLVEEERVDGYRFTHSLARDALYAGLSRSRRARLHARLAVALEGRPEREGEVARHWLAAGEEHAARAWPAAVIAARWAGQLHAVDEAVDLLRSAATSVAVAAATPGQRHDVELALARALQHAGTWSEVRPVIHRALGLALQTGELDRLVETATLPLTGAIWQAAGHGFVDDVVVDALRLALERLQEPVSVPRCRVLLALAGELYYAPIPGPAEREALVDAAVAMARELNDPELLLWALLTGSTAVWRAATAPVRLARLDEAVTLAQAQPADATSHVLSSALALRATALMELGRVPEMEQALVDARAEAERRHHGFALLVLDSVALPWAAMRGDDDECQRLETEAGRVSARAGVFDDSPAGLAVVRAIWNADHDTMLQAAEAIEISSSLPTAHFCAVLRLRAGRADLARAGLSRPRATDDRERAGDAWYSTLAWAMAAEVALGLGDPDLGRWAQSKLQGLSGTPAHTGSLSLGPVDAFAAMAAAAAGDLAAATAYADEALRLCTQWRIPRALDWFTGVRAEHGF